MPNNPPLKGVTPVSGKPCYSLLPLSSETPFWSDSPETVRELLRYFWPNGKNRSANPDALLEERERQK